MKVKVLIGVLVALIVLNLATVGSFVYTQWRAARIDAPPFPYRQAPGPRTSPPEWGRQGKRAPFRPSREERRQLMELLAEFRTDTEELRRKTLEDERRVFELMQREEVPRARVDSLLEEITRARLETGRLAIDKLIESKAYLSPQQQERFFDAILNARPGDGARRGWRGHTRAREERESRRDGERP